VPNTRVIALRRTTIEEVLVIQRKRHEGWRDVLLATRRAKLIEWLQTECGGVRPGDPNAIGYVSMEEARRS
jgi:hypothetical protein